MNDIDITTILDRLGKIECTLNVLVEQRTVKDWYTTAEVAKTLGKAEFTVREWCRLGRVIAQKKKCGRGASSEWIISNEELTRVRNEGLLPEANPYFQVDNPLVNFADYAFIGRHLEAEAEDSSKVLSKMGPKEKVGNFLLVDDRCSMIEYSDLPEQ